MSLAEPSQAATPTTVAAAADGRGRGDEDEEKAGAVVACYNNLHYHPRHKMAAVAVDGGHTFGKKTFHKPTYCHHCSDLLWGLIGQGYICDGEFWLLLSNMEEEAATGCSRNLHTISVFISLHLLLFLHLLAQNLFIARSRRLSPT